MTQLFMAQKFSRNRRQFPTTSDSIPGGIGHKYTSLLHSLTYAILTGRRFIGRISLFD